MGIGTLLGYLFGSRAAILALAAHPWAWLVGLMFVLSAGFAREYDGEDLWHEPWHLLLPLVASLSASFLLYCILYGFSALTRKDGPSFLAGYRSFLGLFWLTAPLAWLYAVPYERFLDPLDATLANLGTLAVVATWRVALMVRVAVVLMGIPAFAATYRVLVYADGVLLLGLCLLPFPLIEIMGGARLTEAEAVVRDAAFNAAFLGGILLPILLIVSLIFQGEARWQMQPGIDAPSHPVSWPVWMVAFLSLAIWTVVLPFTQPEQQLRHQVDVAYREGRIGDALAVMTAHSPEDFPPRWEPPPRYLKGEWAGSILEIWEEILRDAPSPWVRHVYLDKLQTYITKRRPYVDTEKLGSIINRMPESEAVALLDFIDRDESDQRLREWLNLRPELQKKGDGR